MSIRDVALNLHLQAETIDIPEWGGKVLVREMTATQREQFIDNKQDGYMTVDVVLNCAYDPDTEELIFEKADRDKLAAGPAGPLEAVFAKVVAMSRANVTNTVAVEEALDADPLDDSSSG